MLILFNCLGSTRFSVAVGMGGAMLFYQVFVPLLLVATPSFSEEKFGLTGGSIVLQAKPMPEKVSNIIWKHNKDKAAEWFDLDDAPTYYNIFKDVTTLNMQTWALNISNLHPRFNGKYSAEVNNKDPTQFVTLAVLEQVEKPTITMDCLGINCTLTCEGKTDGSTEYTWTNDIGGKWSGSELTVKMTDDDVVYTCSISNQASSASSNPGTVKKYVPPPSVAGTGGIIGVIIGVIIAGFTIYAGICLLVFKKRQEHKEPVADEENQEKPNTVTPPGPPGEHKSPEAVPLMRVTVTEHKETPGDEGKQETTNTGNILNALKTMTCRDRCRIFIPCIKVTSPVPSGEDKDPKAIPLRQSVTENNEAHGGKESPKKTNTEVIKQTEANTDQLHEGELTGNGAGPTADGENNEAHGGKESPEKTNTGAGENPANNQTPLLGNGETEHKEHEEGEENPGDEGKQQLPNTVTSQGPSGEDKSPEAVLAGDEKQAGANQDPSPEGAGENPANNQTPLLGNGETEHKELEGGEENPGDEGKQQLPNTVTPPVPSGEDKSPELDHRLPSVTERKEPDGNEDSPGMPNPEDKRQPETDPDPAPEEKLPANAPGSTAEEEDKRQPETDTDPLLEGKLPANAPGSTAEEENNEAHGGKESPEKTNTEDKKLPKADTDQLHEEKLGEPVETSTGDGENNEAHGGKESPEKTNTEDEKLPKADTDQLHEEKLGEPVETSTADGENNEAHGGKESPEKTNTEH